MGQLNIPDHSLVYVDTAILIYTVEKIPNYAQILEPLWDNLEIGKVKVMTSELTLMETLVMPIKQSDSRLIKAYNSMLLAGYIDLIPINQSILTEGARLRGITNLKTPDAIHLATALSEKCDIFLTNDLGFRKVTDVSILILDEVLNF